MRRTYPGVDFPSMAVNSLIRFQRISLLSRTFRCPPTMCLGRETSLSSVHGGRSISILVRQRQEWPDQSAKSGNLDRGGPALLSGRKLSAFGNRRSVQRLQTKRHSRAASFRSNLLAWRCPAAGRLHDQLSTLSLMRSLPRVGHQRLEPCAVFNFGARAGRLPNSISTI